MNHLEKLEARSNAIAAYERANSLRFLGTMENDDELVFIPIGTDPINIDAHITVWYLEGEQTIGTFEQYCDQHINRGEL